VPVLKNNKYELFAQSIASGRFKSNIDAYFFVYPERKELLDSLKDVDVQKWTRKRDSHQSICSSMVHGKKGKSYDYSEIPIRIDEIKILGQEYAVWNKSKSEQQTLILLQTVQEPLMDIRERNKAIKDYNNNLLNKWTANGKKGSLPEFEELIKYPTNLFVTYIQCMNRLDELNLVSPKDKAYVSSLLNETQKDDNGNYIEVWKHSLIEVVNKRKAKEQEKKQLKDVTDSLEESKG